MSSPKDDGNIAAAVKAATAFAKLPEVPDIPTFLIEGSLYTQHRMPPPQERVVQSSTGGPVATVKDQPYNIQLVNFRGPLDCHCLECHKESVFHSDGAKYTDQAGISQFTKWFVCSRDGRVSDLVEKC